MFCMFLHARYSLMGRMKAFQDLFAKRRRDQDASVADRNAINRIEIVS